ncbi:MAG: transcription-repair coupling factor, partial [Anaerolineae bacterium]|nr:transcription-repair coupling factor [Anaerolineae bacterium]
EPSGPTIDLPLDALLPEEYISEESLRLGIYRRMAGLTSLREIEQITHELEDRFGPLPQEAANLLYLLRVKALATQAEVATVSTENSTVFIGLGSVGEMKRRRADGRLPVKARVADDRLVLRNSLGQEAWRRELEEALSEMAG